MESGTFFQPDGEALTYGGQLGGAQKAALLANNNVAAHSWPDADYYASRGEFPGHNAGLFGPSRGPKLKPSGKALITNASVPASIANYGKARYAVKWSKK